MKKDIVSLETLEEKAEILKVLAHPIRLCIVLGLLENGACNVTNIRSCLGLPQSTISQHLSKLKAVGIVKGERKSLEISYSVKDDFTKCLAKFILDTKNK